MAEPHNPEGNLDKTMDKASFATRRTDPQGLVPHIQTVPHQLPAT